MEFKPIASSSKGNCYIVTSPGVSPLLIEAGIPIRKIREALGFSLSNVAATLISHEHMDHAKAVKDLLKAGVDCYMSVGTAKMLGVDGHHRTTTIEPFGVEMVGPWTVFTFPLEHDAAESFGFFVLHPATNERCLFIPDTGFIKNRFTGVNILCIECNNLEEILSANIINGSIPAVAGRRIRRHHMSLERVISMLKANDLSLCREIWLLHLSDRNSDEAKMIRTVQEVTGIPCRACEK